MKRSAYRVVHLDAGRKYFSSENLRKFIDNCAAAGFGQLELYLSDHQGLRLALDDMRVPRRRASTTSPARRATASARRGTSRTARASTSPKRRWTR